MKVKFNSNWSKFTSHQGGIPFVLKKMDNFAPFKTVTATLDHDEKGDEI
jgi:hypothetical protein